LKYYKNSEQLEVDDKLNGYLNRFKTIDDFRVDEPTELTNNNAEQHGAGSLKQQGSSGGGKKRYRTSSENDTTPAVAMTNDS
jgi:la-related protein 1